MTTLRLHPEPGSKVYAKGPHWRVCDDTACSLQHVSWNVCEPIAGQSIDLSYLEKTTFKARP